MKQAECLVPRQTPSARFRMMLGECKGTFKSGGVKAVCQRYGWKIFAIFFCYYMVRDVLIYILIPYVLAKHIL